MKLATFLPPDATEPIAGEVRGDEVIAFTDGSTVEQRLAIGGGAPANGAAHSLVGIELLAPVLRPNAIYCIALNYREHAEEAGMPLPDRPVAFLKQSGSVISGFGKVRKPAVTEKLDYEGELVVVIGAGGQVGGYAVGNDVSMRDIQKLEFQWARAKGADTFCPWGPWVTTADEIPDAEHLWLKTWVNHELRQDANTNDLVFGIDAIVSALSETADLQPGDIIMTGTPVGIGESFGKFLEPGDTVRIEVEGLGHIEHQIVDR